MANHNADKMARSAYYQNDQVPISLGGYGDLSYKGLTPQFTPSDQLLTQQGLFQNLLSGSGYAAQTLTPLIDRNAGTLLNVGQQQAAAAGAYDPAQQATDQYNLLMQTLGPQQAQQTASTEARLLAQGRLDSSGGALQLGELARAQDASNAQLLASSYDSASQARDQALQTASALSQQGANLQGGLFGELLQGQAGYQSSFAPYFDLINTSQGIKAQDIARRLGASQATYSTSQKGSGAGGIASTIGGLGGAAIGGFLTKSPQGAMAGYQIGSSAGGLFGGGQ